MRGMMTNSLKMGLKRPLKRVIIDKKEWINEKILKKVSLNGRNERNDD
jgi:hypothetical protein